MALDAQIFVSVLGFSTYVFSEATPSQELSCWIGSHVHCFAFLGGVPTLLVPDYVPFLVMWRYLENSRHRFGDRLLQGHITITRNLAISSGPDPCARLFFWGIPPKIPNRGGCSGPKRPPSCEA